MDKNEVKQLLERFYDGTASECEESRLRHYLLSENADAEFDADKKIFQAMQQTSSTPIPDDLENRLSALIDKLDEKERKNKRPRHAIILYMTAAVAAAAVLTAILTLRPGGENNGLQPIAAPQEKDISYTANQPLPADTIPAQPASPTPTKVAKAAEPAKPRRPKRNTMSEEQAAEILHNINPRIAKAQTMCAVGEKIERQQAEALQRTAAIEQRTQKALRQLEQAKELEEKINNQLNTNQL